MKQKTKIYLAAFLAFIGAGFYGFFRTSNPPETESKNLIEEPPSINISFDEEFSPFQGRLTADQACRLPGFDFDADDVDDFEAPSGQNSQSTLKTGDHLYFSQENISVKEIFDQIVPVEDNKIMFAYYSAGNNYERGFHIYPPVTGDVTSIENPENFTVPANEGFILISCKETEIFNVKNENETTNIVSRNLLENNGWFLIPKTSGTVQDSLSHISHRLESIWLQSGPGMTFDPSKRFTFDQVSDDKFGSEKMFWIHLVDSGSQAQNNDNDPNDDGTVDSGENNDDSEQEIIAPTNLRISGYSGNVNVEWDYEGEVNAIDHFALEYQDQSNLDSRYLELDPNNNFSTNINELINTGYNSKNYVFRLSAVGDNEVESTTVASEFSLRNLPTPNNLSVSENLGSNQLTTSFDFDNDLSDFPGLIWEGYKLTISDDPNSQLSVYEYVGNDSELSGSRAEFNLNNNARTIHLKLQNIFNYGESPVISTEFELRAINEGPVGGPADDLEEIPDDGRDPF